MVVIQEKDGVGGVDGVDTPTCETDGETTVTHECRQPVCKVPDDGCRSEKMPPRLRCTHTHTHRGHTHTVVQTDQYLSTKLLKINK